jgi:hypothetical protein
MLCAKGVVDMLLEDENGGDVETLAKTMVADGRVPQSYIVTAERVEEALGMPSVQVQEATDCMGFVDGRWTVIDRIGMKEKL